MGWFRSNRTVVTWLAFFALACQLVLSFGHVHIGKFSGASATWATTETGDASSGSTTPLPQRNPNGRSVDFCALCANMSLAGMLVMPMLAIILAPNLFIGVLRGSSSASEPASFDHLPFDARGPPHA
jgi:hypothetical protein